MYVHAHAYTHVHAHVFTHVSLWLCQMRRAAGRCFSISKHAVTHVYVHNPVEQAIWTLATSTADAPRGLACPHYGVLLYISQL